MEQRIEDLEARLNFVLQRKRMRVVLAVVMTVIGIMLLFMRETLFDHGTVGSMLCIFLGVAAMGTGIGSLLFSYLQSGRSNDLLDPNSNATLRNEVEELRFEVMRLRRNSGGAEEIKELSTVIDSVVNNTLSSEFIAGKIDQLYGKEMAEQNKLRQLQQDFDLLRVRIQNEIARLRKSANLNLVIGTLTTVVAVAGLGYEVFHEHYTAVDSVQLLAHYLPRLSLVIFIEIFAFFFLRMYRANLLDIKYFNNEKTNIDFKVVALKIAIHQENADLIKLSVEELIKTERNFKMSKGETTVELEKLRGDRLSEKNVLQVLEKLKWKG